MTNVWVLAGIGVAGLLSILKLRKQKKDTNGFIEEFEILPPAPPPAPFAPPPLTGLTFAVKDIFDIKGLVTGFGNPDWARTHDAAGGTAPVVLALVEAGATCKGKTHMDELAYSINGENKHYGTPRNPAAPSRIPGGSSSGSAVAVASGKVHFAVGTDTCGSVRLPAAYCGILGIRPSHGVVSIEGAIPMSPSLDTVGWFAKDARLLQLVGQVMLQQQIQGERHPASVYIADDVFDLSSIPKKLILDAVKSVSSASPRRVSVQEINLGSRLSKHIPSLSPFLPSPPPSTEDQGASLVTLTALRDAMRALQSHEFKVCHREWLEGTSPNMAEDIRGRVELALSSSPEKAALALKVRDEARAAMNNLLKADGVLVIPTAPGPPPKLRTKPQELDDFRARAFSILAVAGFSGCPQLTLPVGTINGAPMAVSLVARHGGDALLLQVSRAWAAPILEAVQAKPESPPVVKQSPAEIAKEKGNNAFREGGESKDASIQKAKFKEAVDHYTQAIKLDSKNATLYNNRAMAHLKLCNFDKAETDCDMALQYDPKNVKALLRRGTAREFLGVYDDALSDFEHALVLEPTNKMALDARRRLRSMLSGLVPCEGHQFSMG